MARGKFGAGRAVSRRASRGKDRTDPTKSLRRRPAEPQTELEESTESASTAKKAPAQGRRNRKLPSRRLDSKAAERRARRRKESRQPVRKPERHPNHRHRRSARREVKLRPADPKGASAAIRRVVTLDFSRVNLGLGSRPLVAPDATPGGLPHRPASIQLADGCHVGRFRRACCASAAPCLIDFLDVDSGEDESELGVAISRVRARGSPALPFDHPFAGDDQEGVDRRCDRFRVTTTPIGGASTSTKSKSLRSCPTRPEASDDPAPRGCPTCARPGEL